MIGINRCAQLLVLLSTSQSNSHERPLMWPTSFWSNLVCCLVRCSRSVGGLASPDTNDFRADKRRRSALKWFASVTSLATSETQLKPVRKSCHALSLLVDWGYGCQISEYLILSPVVPTA